MITNGMSDRSKRGCQCLERGEECQASNELRARHCLHADDWKCNAEPVTWSTGRKESYVVSVRPRVVAKHSPSYRSSHYSACCHALAPSSDLRSNCPAHSRYYSSPTNMTFHTMPAWRLSRQTHITVPTTRCVLRLKIPVSRVNQHLHVQPEVLLSADPVGT